MRDRSVFRRRLYLGEYGPFTWWPDPRDCTHENENTCPMCDHDGYYQRFIHAQEAADA